MKRTSLGIIGVSALLIVAPLGAASAADMATKAPPPAATPASPPEPCGSHSVGQPSPDKNISSRRTAIARFGDLRQMQCPIQTSELKELSRSLPDGLSFSIWKLALIPTP